MRSTDYTRIVCFWHWKISFQSWHHIAASHMLKPQFLRFIKYTLHSVLNKATHWDHCRAGPQLLRCVIWTTLLLEGATALVAKDVNYRTRMRPDGTVTQPRKMWDHHTIGQMDGTNGSAEIYYISPVEGMHFGSIAIAGRGLTIMPRVQMVRTGTRCLAAGKHRQT